MNISSKKAAEKKDRRVTRLPPPASLRRWIDAQHVRPKKSEARDADGQAAECGALSNPWRRRRRGIETHFAPGEFVDASEHDPGRDDNARKTDPLERNTEWVCYLRTHDRLRDCLQQEQRDNADRVEHNDPPRHAKELLRSWRQRRGGSPLPDCGLRRGGQYLLVGALDAERNGVAAAET
jgi:hypothetical protein